MDMENVKYLEGRRADVVSSARPFVARVLDDPPLDENEDPVKGPGMVRVIRVRGIHEETYGTKADYEDVGGPFLVTIPGDQLPTTNDIICVFPVGDRKVSVGRQPCYGRFLIKVRAPKWPDGTGGFGGGLPQAGVTVKVSYIISQGAFQPTITGPVGTYITDSEGKIKTDRLPQGAYNVEVGDSPFCNRTYGAAIGCTGNVEIEYIHCCSKVTIRVSAGDNVQVGVTTLPPNVNGASLAPPGSTYGTQLEWNYTDSGGESVQWWHVFVDMPTPPPWPFTAWAAGRWPPGSNVDDPDGDHFLATHMNRCDDFSFNCEDTVCELEMMPTTNYVWPIPCVGDCRRYGPDSKAAAPRILRVSMRWNASAWTDAPAQSLSFDGMMSLNLGPYGEGDTGRQSLLHYTGSQSGGQWGPVRISRGGAGLDIVEKWYTDCICHLMFFGGNTDYTSWNPPGVLWWHGIGDSPNVNFGNPVYPTYTEIQLTPEQGGGVSYVYDRMPMWDMVFNAVNTGGCDVSMPLNLGWPYSGGAYVSWAPASWSAMTAVDGT